MKVLIITTALVAALISNSVNARSETIKCDTGFFSSKSFVIKVTDKRLDCTDEQRTAEATEDFESSLKRILLGEGGGVCDSDNRPYELRELFSTNGEKLDSDLIGEIYAVSNINFSWKEDDQTFTLWEASKGWAIKSNKKDWSSSEGNHWDEVLEKTYCK